MHDISIIYKSIGFSKTGVTNLFIRDKIFDCVNITILTSPEERLRLKHHLTDVTHNSVTIQKYFEFVTKLSLFLCSTEKVFFRIEYFFNSAGRQMQQILLHRSHKIGLNAIRNGNAPFGRLKMF